MIIICGWEMFVAFWTWVPLSKWVTECQSQAWDWLAGAGTFPASEQLSWVPGLGLLSCVRPGQENFFGSDFGTSLRTESQEQDSCVRSITNTENSKSRGSQVF